MHRLYKRTESLYVEDARKVVGEDASADWLPRSVYTALVFSQDVNYYSYKKNLMYVCTTKVATQF